MSATPAVFFLLVAILDPATAGGPPGQACAWNFSIASGIGVREVGGQGFGVPYIGFWAAQERSDTLDLVYEGFVLTPTTIHDVWDVSDVAFGFLVRVNHYFREGAVRPYVTIGGGVVLQRRVTERTRTTRQPAGGVLTTSRSDTEVLLGINSVVGFGVRIRLRDGWDLRPEARIPFPYLPPVIPGHPASSIALAIGVTYTPGGG